MIAGFLRRMMRADALGIVLFIASLQILTYGVSASLPYVDAKYFFPTCLTAASVSYMLGRGRWNRFGASAGIVALGFLFVWILGANLGKPILSFAREVLRGLRTGGAADPPAIPGSWAVIAEASSALLTRWQTWVRDLYQGAPINDPLIAGLLWVLILWLASAWMGWFAEKRNAVASLLPAAFLLAAVTSYSERKMDSLWLLVMTLLLLMGIWSYRNHMSQWEQRRFDYSESVRVDTAQAVIFLTLTIGTAALITPSISWRDVVDRFSTGGANQAAEVLGVQNRPGGSQPVGQEPVLPREHLLGGGSANSEDMVMTVGTGELPPSPSQSATADPPRYYWRSTIYDRYVGAGWVTSDVSAQNIPANTPLIPGMPNGYRAAHLDVHMAAASGRLFWSGILFRSSVPLEVDWRVRPTADPFAERSALLQADMFSVSSGVSSYQADVYIPAPTVTDLRSASTDYPQDILEHYLSLPGDLPERDRDLARQITEGSSDPYDKVKAIERYLRRNYTYDLDIPAPPAGQDVADYFLFDLRRGYCDYYATSMVVLARSIGIPARFVSGFAPGTYDASTARYVIRELDAHSWPEIYFPEIGWVEFEPTASLPAIQRAEGSAPILEDQKHADILSSILTRFRLNRVLSWAAPVLGTIGIVLASLVLIEKWMVLRLVPESAIEQIYQRFYQIGRPLAGEWVGAETSSEYVAKLIDTMDKIKFPSNNFLDFADQFKHNATALTDLYQSTLFTARHTTKQDVQITWGLWMQLRWQVYIARFNLFVWGNKRDVNNNIHL